METQSTAAQIVDDGQRRDRRGRLSWPPERRESSGAIQGQPGAARFAEVRFAPQATVAAMPRELSVTLPGGLIARGADAVALAALVRALWVQARYPVSLPQIGLPSALRIYLALEPVDMRKQYDGL